MRRELSQLNEEDLARLAQYGMIAAFDELVRRYRGAVAVTVRSVLGSRTCVEDTVQEVLLSAFRHIRTLREPERFGPWLHSIARQQAVRRSTKERADRSRLQELVDEQVLRASVELHHAQTQAFMQRARLDELWAEVALLPEDLREPMILSVGEGWSLSQISDFLDLPVSTLKWRMHQARRRLRRKFGERNEEDDE